MDAASRTTSFSKLAQGIVAIIGIGFLIVIGKTVLCPLVFSVLFSFALLPLCKFFERHGMGRALASGVAVLILLGILTGIILLVGSQVHNVTDNSAAFKQQLTQSFQQISGWSKSTLGVDLSQQLNKAASGMEGVAGKAAGMVVLSVSSIFIFLIFLVFDTFFMLFYRKLLFTFLLSLVKKEYEPVVYNVMEKIQATMRQYFLGLLLEMTIVTTACCLIFWAIGIKFPLLLGLIMGIFNIIPYVGIFSALAINIMLTAATGGAAKVIFVVIGVVIVHLVDSNILLPFVVGAKVRINALVTILGLAIGEMMWGIPGMFLSIPVMAIFKIIFDRVQSTKNLGDVLGDGKPEKDTKKKKAILSSRI